MEKLNTQLNLLDRTFVEKLFDDFASKGHTISMHDFVLVVSEELGLGISKLESRIVFEFFLNKQTANKEKNDMDINSKEILVDAFIDQAFAQKKKKMDETTFYHHEVN